MVFVYAYLFVMNSHNLFIQVVKPEMWLSECDPVAYGNPPSRTVSLRIPVALFIDPRQLSTLFPEVTLP